MPGSPGLARNFLGGGEDTVRHTFMVPLPPSTNNLYKTITNWERRQTFRAESKEYKQWRKEVTGLAVTPTFFPAHQIWRVHIDLGRMPHNRDVDNCAKAIIDLIVRETGLADQWLNVLLVHRSPNDWGGRCEVTFRTDEGE